MPKAVWEGAVLAESDNCVEVDGNRYFPHDSLKKEYFKPSDTTSTCWWKGEARYYDIVVEGKTNPGAAWYYPEPKEKARHFINHVAFWKGVRVEE